MRIILLQDVEKLGKKYDVKDVADGYGRNFLIPKGLAKLANKEAMLWLETKKEIENKKEEENLKKIQEMASSIDDRDVIIEVKIGEQDQLFESINAQKVADKLKEIGFEVKKSQVDLAEPIKELGEFPIKIKFDHNLEAEIKLILVQKKEK